MSRLLCIAVLFLTLSFHQSIHAAAPFDIVIDLDYTLAYPISPAQLGNIPAKELIQIEGQYYRLTDGASEFIAHLQQRPNVRISFYSGGSASRNRELLKSIRLPNGKNAYDIAYKVLNKEDLIAVPGAKSTDRFSMRYKKDLSKISGPSLDRTILIDDNSNFFTPGQKRNLLHLGDTYDYEHVYDATKGKSAYQASNQQLWSKERNKLAWATGTIDEALEQTQKHGGSFVGHVNSLTLDAQGNWIKPTSPQHAKLYQRGEILLDQVNPDWQAVKLQSHSALECIQSILK